jgi:hypothetical protein
MGVDALGAGPQRRSMQPSKDSPMPAGLLDSLTEDEVQDLVAYLLAPGGSRDGQPRP